MRRELKLKPIVPHGRGIEFAWDPDAGAFTGPDAAEIQALVDDANRAGTVVGHPHPTVFEMTDPARIPGELAVVLGQFWQLPEDLQQAYPQAPPDDAPPGAVY